MLLQKDFLTEEQFFGDQMNSSKEQQRGFWESGSEVGLRPVELKVKVLSAGLGVFILLPPCLASPTFFSFKNII